MNASVNGGRFDFDDGGTYCGGWNDGKAHGHGVCTGPKGQGEYSGAWQFGYEFSGIYLWPSGNSYEGQWMSGKRHGLGVEKKGKWIYKGEWTQGFKGRYGTRISDISGARYEGTWANGLQDGYGVEIYADGGIYHGQIQQGLRHGFGIRRSVPYGLASRYRAKDVRDSLTSLRSEEDDERTQRERDKRMDENRGGFVLRSRSDSIDKSFRSASQGPRRGSLSNSGARRSSLRKTLMAKLRKQKSTSDIEDMSITKKTSSFRSTASSTSGDSKHSVKTANIISSHGHTPNSTNTLDDGDRSFISQEDILDNNVIETYMGEWKADKRSGFGIAERSDGLKYEGEWFNNKKHGYGVTTFRDGVKEEGKYQNNVLVTDLRKASKLFLLRTSKIRDKIDVALNNAMKAATTAQQKAEIAMARANNARLKAHSAEIYAKQARGDSLEARISARAAAPDFRQPGEEKPQPFITLDIDRQVDGQVVTASNIPMNAPNGRLTVSSNNQGSGPLPMPSYLSQAQPTTNNAALPPFLLDGGVYLGQPMPTSHKQQTQQTTDWNPNQKIMGPQQISTMSVNHQSPDYYQNKNFPVNTVPGAPYNMVSNPQTGMSVSNHPMHGMQPLPSGDKTIPRTVLYDNDRVTIASTNMSSNFQSNASQAQFVANPTAFDSRANPRRSTFKRTEHVDASAEDLSHDQQHKSTNESHARPRLKHGANSSQNSSGHDSGNQTHSSSYTTNRSTTPAIENYDVPPPIPIPKRKSLPSIVKANPNDYKVDETARSSDHLPGKETFIIENGIRKRVTAQPPTYTESGSLVPQASVMTSSSGSPVLVRRVLLESVNKLDPATGSHLTGKSTAGGAKRGSMPTLVNIARHRQEAPPISREEASMLGSRRREELRRQRDFDSTVIGRVKNLLQNVVYRNRVFIAIFFLNLSLALWFIQLLR